MEDASQFNREELTKLLSLLNEELARSDTTGAICIVEGAAMILAYGSRHSTRDIDALAIAPSAIREAAVRVADRNNIPANWLNDGVKGFSPSNNCELKELLFFSHLRVLAPPAEFILAMKRIAARAGLDSHYAEDAKFLIRHLKLSTPSPFWRLSKITIRSRGCGQKPVLCRGDLP